MQRFRPVGHFILAASVLSALTLTGCKTGVDAQANGSPDAPVSLKQVAGPADLGADSVVSAAKSTRGVDPRTLEQSAPPSKPNAPPPTTAKPVQPVGPMKVIGIITPNGIKPVPESTRKDSPVNTAPSSARVNDVTAEKFNTDLAKVHGLERALHKYNLKLKTVTDRGRRFIDWDQDLLDQYDGPLGAALPALKQYRRAVTKFLENYDRQFTVDGSSEMYRKLSSGQLDVLISKLQMVERTIDYIERHQDDAEDYHSGLFESFFA